MSDTTKRHVVSGLQTFAAAAILDVSAQLSVIGHIEWTSAFFVALLGVAIRAGIKAVVEMTMGASGDPQK